MKDVYISSVGMAKFGKRNHSLEGLALEAISDCGNEINSTNIDAVFYGNMSGEKFTGNSNLASLITDHLGLAGKPATRIDTASSTGAAVFQIGYYAIASGVYKNALIIASEKMSHIPTSRATSILAEVIDPFERACGCTMTALAAMITRNYMHKYGLTNKELAQVSIKNHFNGSLNKYAHFQKPVTLETILNSKVVSSPLRLYDCSPISDGAAAIVLSSKPSQIRISGIGHGTAHVPLQYRDSLTSFSATRIAAASAYKMANITPEDVDVAEVHDAFSTFEIINTEDLGLFEPGKAREALLDGITRLDGDLPINPSGGLKARGHPVGVSGLAQIVELFWQLQGTAGSRQVKDARVGLSQSIGGLATNNLVNILEVAK
jgi:acetyl-CoA acetyltransferase